MCCKASSVRPGLGVFLWGHAGPFEVDGTIPVPRRFVWNRLGHLGAIYLGNHISRGLGNSCRPTRSKPSMPGRVSRIIGSEPFRSVDRVDADARLALGASGLQEPSCSTPIRLEAIAGWLAIIAIRSWGPCAIRLEAIVRNSPDPQTRSGDLDGTFPRRTRPAAKRKDSSRLSWAEATPKRWRLAVAIGAVGQWKLRIP